MTALGSPLEYRLFLSSKLDREQTFHYQLSAIQNQCQMLQNPPNLSSKKKTLPLTFTYVQSMCFYILHLS